MRQEPRVTPVLPVLAVQSVQLVRADSPAQRAHEDPSDRLAKWAQPALLGQLGLQVRWGQQEHKARQVQLDHLAPRDPRALRVAFLCLNRLSRFQT